MWWRFFACSFPSRYLQHKWSAKEEKNRSKKGCMWWRFFACSCFLGCHFFFLYQNHILVQEESVTLQGCEHPYFLRRGCNAQSKMYLLCLAELPHSVCGSPRSLCPWDVLYANRAARTADSQAVLQHPTGLHLQNTISDGINKNFKMAAAEH